MLQCVSLWLAFCVQRNVANLPAIDMQMSGVAQRKRIQSLGNGSTNPCAQHLIKWTKTSSQLDFYIFFRSESSAIIIPGVAMGLLSNSEWLLARYYEVARVS